MHGLSGLPLLHILICLGQVVHGSKIINGQIAPENLMQYMVSVQSKEGHHACGGFLITEDFVVSAAHCAVPQPDHILLGCHKLNSSKIRKIKVDSICKHPNYTDVSKGDDIMLLKLSKKALPDKSVKIIPLPSSEVPQKEHETCSVAGWGITEISINSSVNELRVVNVSVVNTQLCEEQWKFKLPNVICAGGYYENKGFCQGDSGGPLVCNGTAVGVVSFNRSSKCKYPDIPNVYTDISKYLQWINKILKEKTCSS